MIGLVMIKTSGTSGPKLEELFAKIAQSGRQQKSAFYPKPLIGSFPRKKPIGFF